MNEDMTSGDVKTPELATSSILLIDWLPTFFGCLAVFGWVNFGFSLNRLIHGFCGPVVSGYGSHDHPYLSSFIFEVGNYLPHLLGTLLFAITATLCIYRRCWARNLFILASWWLLLLGGSNMNSRIFDLYPYLEHSSFNSFVRPFALIILYVSAMINLLLPNFWLLPLLLITRRSVFLWFEQSTLSEPHLCGISGWLILPALGLFLNVIGSLIAFFYALVHVSYFPGQYSVPISILVGSGISFLLDLLILFPFFKRHHKTPALMIARYLIQAAIAMVFTYVIHKANTTKHIGYVSTMYKPIMPLSILMLTTLIPCSVWLTYFTTSRRVRATFARPSTTPSPAYTPNELATATR